MLGLAERSGMQGARLVAGDNAGRPAGKAIGRVGLIAPVYLKPRLGRAIVARALSLPVRAASVRPR